MKRLIAVSGAILVAWARADQLSCSSAPPSNGVSNNNGSTTLPPPQISTSPTPQNSTPPPTMPAATIMRFGYPCMDNIRVREGHVLSYNTKHRSANWVCERMTADLLNSKIAERANQEFREDETFHQFFRATNADYKGSGYDRGHLAAAANQKWSTRAMYDTFWLSNISPQVGKGFNRDAWNTLESYTRSLTKQYAEVYVCSGPLFLPVKDNKTGKQIVTYEVIGENQVSVPTHFYKVIACVKSDQTVEIQSFIMPNQAIPDGTHLKSFLVPLWEVEKKSGYLFLERIPNRYNAIKRDKHGNLAGHF